MKRIFLLKGLDCPNCSAKIEKEEKLYESGFIIQGRGFFDYG